MIRNPKNDIMYNSAIESWDLNSQTWFGNVKACENICHVEINQEQFCCPNRDAASLKRAVKGQRFDGDDENNF